MHTRNCNSSQVEHTTTGEEHRELEITLEDQVDAFWCRFPDNEDGRVTLYAVNMGAAIQMSTDATVMGVPTGGLLC